MPYSENGISTPISIDDVKTAVGMGSNDLATLCKANSIDKWARNKPISYNNNFSNNEGKGGGNFGLTPVIITGNSDYTNDTTAMKEIIDICIGSKDDWSYDRPSGGSNSPYRLGDFLGYKKNNYPPLYMDYKDKTELTINVQVTPTYMWGLSAGNAIGYNEFSILNNNDLYLWGFVSTNKKFTTFNYFKSNETIDGNARAGTQITVGRGRMYFVFAFGNNKGNKFITIPNSYNNTRLTNYPVSAIFYRSFFKEDISLITANSKDTIFVRYGNDSYTSVLDLESPYGTNDDYYLILAINQSRRFSIAFNATPLTSSYYSLSAITLVYEGAEIALTELRINNSYAGSLAFIKDKSQFFEFIFDNVFSDYDTTTNQVRQLDIQLKLNGNTLINFYGTALYSIGGKAINEDGFIPYKYEQN